MSRRGEGITVAALVGAVSSGGASVVVALCCVGPAVYGMLGAGGVLAAARLAPLRPYLLVVAGLFLAVGFWSASRLGRISHGAAGCRMRGARVVRMVLWSAAVLTVIAAALGQFLG